MFQIKMKTVRLKYAVCVRMHHHGAMELELETVLTLRRQAHIIMIAMLLGVFLNSQKVGYVARNDAFYNHSRDNRISVHMSN